MRPPFETWFPGEPDATHGYDLEALLEIAAPPPPSGFARWWQEAYAAALAVDPGLRTVAQLPSPSAAHSLREVRFRSAGGVTLGGWLALPLDGAPRLAIVHSHGYGGRAAPDFENVPVDAAAIFPVARGLPSVSLLPDVPPDAAGHVLVGIDSVDDYVLGGCAADVWTAATALQEEVGVGVPLVFVGGSFGGGQGALALPWDPRFSAAVLTVPSFGQHDLRLRMPCTGSGESVRRHVAERPESREVLRFFDAATAAAHQRIPTRVECALWDPAVPPPGQFAVFNALPGERELAVLPAGHTEYPTKEAESARSLAERLTFLDRHAA